MGTTWCLFPVDLLPCSPALEARAQSRGTGGMDRAHREGPCTGGYAHRAGDFKSSLQAASSFNQLPFLVFFLLCKALTNPHAINVVLEKDKTLE